MKYLFSLSLLVLLFALHVNAAEEPMPFDKFFKTSMKVTPGIFPVYQDGERYFMEIPAACLDKDILIIGDVTQGASAAVASSSGVIRFTPGTRQQLNITRQEYKEAVSHGFNLELEPLVQQSNLIPVSFVVRIEALGKTPGSFIVELTRNLVEAGQFFAFRENNALSRPDPARSGVQSVKAAGDAVTFSVLRTQTNTGGQKGKNVDVASAFVVNLTFQLLKELPMQGREADPRIGFSTISYNDFGKSPYSVKNVKLIRKWRLQVKPEDSLAYAGGRLVTPAIPVTVYIDRNIPAVFIPYVRAAIVQWDKAFAAAGFMNVFRISNDEQDNYLRQGNLLIKWGNAHGKVVTDLIEDPRSGEILTAKMNISEQVLEELMPQYFAACALVDKRLLNNPAQVPVQGDLLEWAVTNAMGQLLGMEPNLCGSAAYSLSQLRNAAWVANHGFTASVTDDLPFNYVAQPGDLLPVTSLMAKVGAYDSLAIGWAYRLYQNEKTAAQSLDHLAYANPVFRYLPESKDDPCTQSNDLSGDKIAAAEIGVKNVCILYPDLEKITGKFSVRDEDFFMFKILSDACFKAYDNYLKVALSLIGGQSARPLLRGYNETAIVYIPKKEQQQAWTFLQENLFKGVPACFRNRKSTVLGAENVEDGFLRIASGVMARLVNKELIARLVTAENAIGNNAFTAADLFKEIDRSIFLNFSATVTPDLYHMELQRMLLRQLTESVSKNPVLAGLDGVNEVLHLYFTRTLKQVDRLSRTHQNAAVRLKYQLFKADIEREFLKKPL